MSLKRKATDTPTSDAKKPKANGSITSFFGAPKSAPKSSGSSNGTAHTAVNFDKEKWVKTLTAEQKDLLKLEIDTLHESWLKELKDEVTSAGFLDLKRFLKRERESGQKIFPKEEDVYSWFVDLHFFSPHSIPLSISLLFPLSRLSYSLSPPSTPFTRIQQQHNVPRYIIY